MISGPDRQTTSSAAAFADRLAARMDEVGSPLCVGLDPVYEKLPAELRGAASEHPATAIARFDEAVLEATRHVAAAVKFQSACYERHGAAGWESLAGGIELARAHGLLVILDGKRGDIGLSASHYAASAVELGADAVTVNAYLGPSGVEPFIEAGLGVFCLVRTSNPDSDVVQSARLRDGRTVAELIASHVARLGVSCVGRRGLSGVGAVVGGTKAGSGEIAALRGAMPDQVFLVPGIGAQGGRPSDVPMFARPGRRGPGESGVVITASRSVIYAESGPGAAAGGWRRSVAHAASELAGELRAVLAH